MSAENVPQTIKDAIKRFQMAVDAEQEARRSALEDLKFYSGEQWPDAIKKQRESEGRPCHTINRLPQFVRQVTNEYRQNRPAVKISPVDDKSDPETAEILSGIIRHIEYDSDADVAYDRAFEMGVVTGGPGWIRIDWELDDDGKPVLKINSVRNSMTVYDDPSAQKADRSDSRWRFFIEDLTKDEYKKLYPKSELASLDDWASVGDQTPGWLSDEKVRIAEYFYFDDDESSEDADEKEEKSDGKLKWCKINAVEVLEETTIPCRWIPSVPYFGEEIEVDGKLSYRGVVREAKDSQRMYNYWASKETEAISLAPNAPYIGWTGQFQGQEGKWGTANTKNWAYLEANPVIVGGQPAPSLPQRQAIEPAVQAITQARMASAEDLQATTGIYRAQLGAPSSEQTGKAILARQQQGQVSNLHYIDNFKRTIRHVGRILLSMAPKLYKQDRVERIIGEDGEFGMAKLSPGKSDPVNKIYDITTGKYDVTVSSGPSFQTKRQENKEMLAALINANPQLMNVAGDLFVKEMDFALADKLSERLKKMLPPQLQDDDQNKSQAQLAQAQQQMMALNEACKQYEAMIQKLQQEKEAKVVETQGRVQIAQMQEMSKQEIVKMQEATKLAVAQINASKDMNQGFAERELEQYKILHGSAHERAMQVADQTHESQMADKQADAAMMQQTMAAEQQQDNQAQ